MEEIAYLGMGIMGRGMAQNLVDAGYDVTVWNRTPEKTKPVVEKGAKKAETIAKAVKGADVILYCLADDAAVRDVVFGEDGVLATVEEGQIVVDMSTVYPDTVLHEAEAYAKKGVGFLDAPVFGSKNEAAEGGLWIVVGGQRDLFETLKPVLEPLSATLHYMGASGNGARMKLVGNLVVASQLEALGEAMVLATKAGLDPEDVLDVLHVTDFRSPIFDNVGEMLVNRNFEPYFALGLLLKDANLIARFAEELNAPIPAAAVIRENIKAAVNKGWGEENASAFIKELEERGQAEVKV